MLVEQILDEGIDAASSTCPQAEALYLRANATSRRSRSSLTGPGDGSSLLQAGDRRHAAIWQQLIDVSLAGLQRDLRAHGRAAHRCRSGGGVDVQR